jgi:hypothetical protein
VAWAYGAAVKTARMGVVRAAIDAGSGPGKIEIGTGGMAVILATLTLQDPGSTVSGPVLTIAGLPLIENASVTGTAAEARITDSDGTVVASGLTVGTSGADLIVASTNFVSGQPVRLTAGTITHG